ncbi:MAG: GNAT family N-acetyltransferase [Woeseiaceae bacterium]
MSDERIRIREGAITDADTLAAIGTQSFREAYGPHSSVDDLESHIRNNFAASVVRAEIEQHKRAYLIATVGDQAGGIAKYRPAPCPVPGGDANAIELQQLYVLASMQGHGLGKRLVSHLIDVSRQARAKGIWLSAWEFADWATGFYRKSGFVEIGNVEFKLGEMIHTDLLMWKSLE